MVSLNGETITVLISFITYIILFYKYKLFLNKNYVNNSLLNYIIKRESNTKNMFLLSAYVRAQHKGRGHN